MTMAIIPNQRIVDKVYARMQEYRPDLRRETIVAILTLTLNDAAPPYGETWFDVWFAYKHLEEIEQEAEA